MKVLLSSALLAIVFFGCTNKKMNEDISSYKKEQMKHQQERAKEALNELEKMKK